MLTSKHSKYSLGLFQCNQMEFLHRFVTAETWVHDYQPETKEQSKQWISGRECAPKKTKTIPSAGNYSMMATVFWDASGIILIDFLEKVKMTTGQY